MFGGIQPAYWWWWIAGVVLLIFELMAPGAVFVWLAIAAGIVGLIVFAVPDLGLEYQFLVFAVLSIASVVVWRRLHPQQGRDTDVPALNRRGEQFIGQTATLAQPIVNGQGRVHLADTSWIVEGADAPSGTRIRIVGTNGIRLKVEPIDTA
jgi:membrane protein implicated in regulation of membrane protease activity